VLESCRIGRREETEGGTGEPSRTATETAVLQVSESGTQVNEGARWDWYRAVAPYLKDSPDIWRQDS
jgi:hypothetical protein